MSGYARAPGTRGRQRITGLPASEKPVCLARWPANTLPAPCLPPSFSLPFPLLTFFPISLPDRNAYLNTYAELAGKLKSLELLL